MKTQTRTRFLALAAVLLSPGLAVADDVSLRLYRFLGDDGLQNFQTDNSPTPLNFTLPGSVGYGSASVSYGGADFDLNTSSTANPGGIYGGQLTATASINQTFGLSATDAGLNGTQGTIIYSYRLSGSFSNPGYIGYSDFSISANGQTYEGGIYAGVPQSQSPNSTVTFQQGFTFNSAGSALSWQTTVRGVAGITRPDSGFPANVAHVGMSVRAGAVTVLDNQGHTVGYSMTSNTGAAQASNITTGGSFTSFTLANTAGLGSTLSLLDGTATGAEYLRATFLSSPNASGGMQAFSDAVDFSGTGSDKFVLQLSFNEAAVLAAGLTDASLHLEWLDPADGTFKDSYLGNSDGGASHQLLAGPYLGGAQFQLGNYGVDPLNHVLWAVVDHNSEFVVGQSVPEPSTWVALLGGVGMLAGWKRFGRKSRA